MNIWIPETSADYSIVSSSNHVSGLYPASNIRADGVKDIWPGNGDSSNFWNGPDGTATDIVLDLGKTTRVDYVVLRNGYNSDANYDRYLLPSKIIFNCPFNSGIKDFELLLASDYASGPWTSILNGTLAQGTAARPTYRTGFNIPTPRSGQFLKISCVTFHQEGCSLQYFGVE